MLYEVITIANINTEDRDYLINSYIESTQTILSRYRSLRNILTVPSVNKELFDIYVLGDEFMSNIVEQHSYLIADKLRRKHPQIYLACKNKLLDLIRSEVSYT